MLKGFFFTLRHVQVVCDMHTQSRSEHTYRLSGNLQFELENLFQRGNWIRSDLCYNLYTSLTCAQLKRSIPNVDEYASQRSNFQRLDYHLYEYASLNKFCFLIQEIFPLQFFSSISVVLETFSNDSSFLQPLIIFVWSFSFYSKISLHKQ